MPQLSTHTDRAVERISPCEIDAVDAPHELIEDMQHDSQHQCDSKALSVVVEAAPPAPNEMTPVEEQEAFSEPEQSSKEQPNPEPMVKTNAQSRRKVNNVGDSTACADTPRRTTSSAKRNTPVKPKVISDSKVSRANSKTKSPLNPPKVKSAAVFKLVK